jgi:hypothetical protein
VASRPNVWWSAILEKYDSSSVWTSCSPFLSFGSPIVPMTSVLTSPQRLPTKGTIAPSALKSCRAGPLGSSRGLSGGCASSVSTFAVWTAT